MPWWPRPDKTDGTFPIRWHCVFPSEAQSASGLNEQNAQQTEVFLLGRKCRWDVCLCYACVWNRQGEEGDPRTRVCREEASRGRRPAERGHSSGWLGVHFRFNHSLARQLARRHTSAFVWPLLLRETWAIPSRNCALQCAAKGRPGSRKESWAHRHTHTQMRATWPTREWHGSGVWSDGCTDIRGQRNSHWARVRWRRTLAQLQTDSVQCRQQVRKQTAGRSGDVEVTRIGAACNWQRERQSVTGSR